MPIRACVTCGRRFRARAHNSAACSDDCRRAAHSAYNRAHASGSDQRAKQKARADRWYRENRDYHRANVAARDTPTTPAEQRQIDVLEIFAEAQRVAGRMTRYGWQLLRTVRGMQGPGKAVGRWFITPHAVRRYIERAAPDATYEQALGALVDYSESAHFVRPRGTVEEWRAPRPDRIRFRVDASGDSLPVLVTVLTAHAH